MHDGPPESYYSRTARAQPDYPRLDSAIETETCVIGGGLAGIATALGLAERGRQVVLLEAGRVGQGASGLNGGFVSAGFGRGLLDLEELLGAAHAKALFGLSQAAVRLLKERIERYAIACDPVAGVVEASWFDDAAGLAATTAELNERFGTGFEFWPREHLRALYRSARYHDGVFDPGGFHCHPLDLVHGLARAATGQGAALFERSPVRRQARVGDRFLVETPAGQVRADNVVLCTGASRPMLEPRLARAVLAISTYILLTAPLGERLGQVIGAPHAVYDDRFATGYYRPLADGRLLWGGRISVFRRPPGLAALMRRDLARVYPELADAPVDLVWTGAMPFLRHRMPVVRPLDPGLWVATGFGGHGLNTTTMAGEMVAGAIAGTDDDWRLLDPFGLPPSGGVLGPAAAQAVYWGRSFRDEVQFVRQRRQQSRRG